MYDIELLNGFVKINTLSPNGKYYFRITKPKEVAMSVYAADLAFFDNRNSIIYCTKDKPASYLPPFEIFQNVLWLKDGDFAFFIEYKRDVNDANVLSLGNQTSYKKRLKKGENIEGVIDLLTSNQQRLGETFFIENEFIPNKEMNTETFKEGIFNRWFPKV